jgi:hypothetical protein
MFYEDRLSTEPVCASIVGAKRLRAAAGAEMLIDYEDGGIDISDPSEGLQYQVWKAYVTENRYIWIEALTTGQKYQLIDAPGLMEISFTFDQNCRPTIAYEASGEKVYMYWYDSLIADYYTTSFGKYYDSMKVFLDDKRQRELLRSDIICTYIKTHGGGNKIPGLYMRRQRDRYTVEYLLREGITGPIYQFGMGNNWRLQWVL